VVGPPEMPALMVAGERARVKRMVGAVADAGLGQVVDRPVPVVTLADEAADRAGATGAVVPA